MGICIDNVHLSECTELRRNAEELLKATSPDVRLLRTEIKNQQLVHELEVHQIELEMQNAELRLARYEQETALEKYTDLYEFAPVGYVTLDNTGIINSLNLAAAGLIGGMRSLLIGRNFVQFVAAADCRTFTEFLGKVLACQIKESCAVKLRNVAHQPVIVQIEAMATASGQELRFALIDITEQSRAGDALMVKQRELEELNGTLELRITQAVNDQRRMDQISIVQDRRAAIGEMIGNIAHQWRQPLNALGLNLQELPLAYGKAKFNKEYLNANISKSMQLIMHMSHTIEDFRNFFKADKEKVTFSVNQVIKKTLSLIEENFREQQICIVFNAESDPKIDGFPNEYLHVLLNILMNSRDALVGRTRDDARILIRSFSEAGKTVVTVSDNAGGIASEIIDSIFDPYFTTKGADKGTGIGLFMSKTIIEKNMGGTLSALNTELGVEFRIEL
jgi:signal transduction histidine kinase